MRRVAGLTLVGTALLGRALVGRVLVGRALVGTALAIAVLAGCGSGGDPESTPSATRPTVDGPVSYADARAIVVAEAEPGWDNGTFCLDDRKITENAAWYVFAVGAKEYIVDGDRDYTFDGGVPVVHKADGRLEWLPSTEVATDDTLESRDNPDPTEPLCG